MDTIPELEPLTDVECALLREGKSVEALKSIRKRFRGTYLGELAPAIALMKAHQDANPTLKATPATVKHFPGCWELLGHQHCAVAEIHRLRALLNLSPE